MNRQDELLEHKRRAMELMNIGVSWQEANERSGLNYSRRGIQQLYQRWREHGDEALIDNRHGHSYKATIEVQDWLGERCAEDSEACFCQAKKYPLDHRKSTHLSYLT